MDIEELEGYVNQSQSLLAASPQMNEQNTRRKIIEPLLKLLGWDMLSTDVELEYSVQMGVGTKKVDYALMIEDTQLFSSKQKEQTLRLLRTTEINSRAICGKRESTGGYSPTGKRARLE